MIGLIFLVVVVVLVVAYGFWLKYCRSRPQLDDPNEFFVWVPSIVGGVGIVVLWLAFAKHWPFALSLNWSIGWTAILVIAAIIALFLDAVMYYFGKEDKKDNIGGN
jgi:hypothetical protein